jgi:sec-independent protein translocase protein TatA
MGGLSIWHWIIVIAVILLLFGRGKISELMGDVAQGIKSFKKGMAEDDDDKKDPTKVDPKTIDHQPAPPVAPQAESRPETKPADRQPEAAGSQGDQRKVG